VLETLIGEGINVNLDLIFSLAQYECVAEAYVKGVNKLQDPSRLRSVASFSLGQLDGAVNRALTEVGSDEALRLRGQAGIAAAKLADLRFREIFFGPDFQSAKARGVAVQRLLWADVNAGYMEKLVGPGTVHSISPENLETLREQDRATVTLEQGQSEAEDVLGGLERMEISLHSLAQALVDECILGLQHSFDETLAILETRRTQVLAGRVA
jgi:transaldolase